MKKITNYSGFRAINELDTTGTYLDRGRERFTQTEYPKFRKMFGKVFTDAPKTSGVDYGLKYEGGSSEFNIYDDSYHRWGVVFPKDFYKHFVPKGENVEEWRDKNADIVGELMNDLSGIEIHTEGGLNRTHFPKGLPKSLLGYNLGFKIYRKLLNFLGFMQSEENATKDVQEIYRKLLQIPSINAVVYKDSVLLLEDGLSKDEVIDIVRDSIYERYLTKASSRKLVLNRSIIVSSKLLKMIGETRLLNMMYELFYTAKKEKRVPFEDLGYKMGE